MGTEISIGSPACAAAASSSATRAARIIAGSGTGACYRDATAASRPASRAAAPLECRAPESPRRSARLVHASVRVAGRSVHAPRGRTGRGASRPRRRAADRAARAGGRTRAARRRDRPRPRGRAARRPPSRSWRATRSSRRSTPAASPTRWPCPTCRRTTPRASRRGFRSRRRAPGRRDCLPRLRLRHRWRLLDLCRGRLGHGPARAAYPSIVGAKQAIGTTIEGRTLGPSRSRTTRRRRARARSAPRRAAPRPRAGEHAGADVVRALAGRELRQRSDGDLPRQPSARPGACRS